MKRVKPKSQFEGGRKGPLNSKASLQDLKTERAKASEQKADFLTSRAHLAHVLTQRLQRTHSVLLITRLLPERMERGW